MKRNRVRLTESQLHRVIKESVNRVLQEVAGYQSTMQKANNQFDQNTFMGRLRSKIMPKKYQQYQRIQQQGNQIGQDAADRINNERRKISIDLLGGGGVYDYQLANYGKYARQQGVSNNGERPEPENYKNHEQYLNDRASWYKNVYDQDMEKGEELYKQRTRGDQRLIDKYGTGGRLLKPMEGWDTDDYQRRQEEYIKQMQQLGQ